jgi:hypothetical protein
MSDAFYTLLNEVNQSGRLPSEEEMISKFNSFVIMAPDAVISHYTKHPVYKSSIGTVRQFVEDMSIDELKKVLINELDIQYPMLMKSINNDADQTKAFLGLLNAAITELKPEGDHTQ